ncbi:MAG TPA: hypothetical protein ENK58_02660 [Desulfobacterales bacterium]|nr:MAG: hypothetical protein DRI57_17465 [Deltaproteobacteria bacterium]HHC24306.1 hypothetical protein [Desulfobacterales bacterium]
MKNRVVIAGWGQITQGKEQTENILDPLELMTEVSLRAGDEARSADILRNLDGVMVVRVLSKYYASAARQLAEKIGATPRFASVSNIGGNSPQLLVNKAAGMIARRELETVLIAGAEAYYPRGGKKEPENALFQGVPDGYQGDGTVGSTESETIHGMAMPIHGFPLYETALWAASGLELAAYQEQIGNLWATFSEVAATHPNSWTNTPRTVEEIITPTGTNRLISFPYTKFMNPLISADLGAAIILMSEEKARQYAQGKKRPVYFLGGGYAEDRQRFLIQKSDFISSPPLKAAVRKALQRSHLSLDEIECFDIYSCFPCAVSVARRMLALKNDDPRALTLTGGLGFFGGPGNNYSLHAVATLADAIANGKNDNGMITSLGWFMHKHAVGVYSAFPADTDIEYHDLEDEKEYVAGEEPVEIIEQASGKGVIETYTVIYSRNGAPLYAIIYGKTDQGLRFVAQTHSDPNVFDTLTTRNQVGRSVHLKYDAQKNRNIAEL